MRRVPHDENTALLHIGRVSVIHSPRVGGEELDLQFRVSDKLARDIRGHGFIHVWCGFVDVVTPDN